MAYIIHSIDHQYTGSELEIFSFLVDSSEGPVLIETGPHSTHQKLVSEIAKIGFKPEDIQHVLLTHIHLDHAGGAWCFADHGADIYLHPKGYRHMHDPSRLLSSAQRIYGDMMDRLWGTLKPIAADQLHIVEDGQSINIGELNIVGWHTPGHAKHHVAWQLDNILFTGDLAGIREKSGSVIPPLPPPDIDIDLWISQIDRMLAIDEIDQYYVTHGGLVNDTADHMAKLKDTLIAYSDFVKSEMDSGKNAMEILQPFIQFASHRLRQEGMAVDDLQRFVNGGALLADVHGLMRYWSTKESNS